MPIDWEPIRIPHIIGLTVGNRIIYTRAILTKNQKGIEINIYLIYSITLPLIISYRLPTRSYKLGVSSWNIRNAIPYLLYYNFVPFFL
jgi:hypothetical protein